MIDEWLATNRAYEWIGKYFIAKQIMQHEYEQCFKQALIDRDEDWYGTLWQRMLSADRKIESIANNQVAFVTFNYDRSLEQNFMMRAQNTFVQVPMEDCARHIARIPIVHVHGQAGRLPWQDEKIPGFEHLNDVTKKSFDTAAAPQTIKDCSAHIKIIAETDGDTFEYKWAKTLLQKAERVHFLGFGYHDQNLLRLKQESYSSPNIVMSGTCKGVEEWKIKQLTTVQNPFGFPIGARGDREREGVASYLYHAVRGWDEYRP